MTMTTRSTRRDILKGTLALAGLGLVGLPDWVLPALAQGEAVVPFLDWPERVITNPAPDRRIIDILGGEVHGPRLSGEILPGGADWQIVRPSGSSVADIRYTLKTDRGALLYVQSHGVRHGTPDVLARLAAGEDVDPSEYTFRTTVSIETSAPELAWLNDGVFIAVGARQPSGVSYDVYLVE